MLTLEEIQKSRYSRGAIVYNTNNYTFGVVIDGTVGKDTDPCSSILEVCGEEIMINCPPNRALIPTGRFFNIDEIISAIQGDKEVL